MKLRPSSVLLLLVLSTAVSADDGGVLHLPIGDPERRGREAPLVLDAITDTHTGELLTPGELASRLAGVDMLFVGESHTQMEFHRVQLRVLEALVAAGRQVLVGLEMYPYTQQPHLDAWIAGHYTEEGFLERSEWYDSWGYHWGYYRDVFLFAREHRLPMIALNSPREVVKAVREKGFEGLSEEEAAHVPPEVDLESDEHRRLFRAFFDADDAIHAQMSEEQWEGMFRAQCTWDATMAHNAVRGLAGYRPEGSAGREAILVVLIGSGHVAYDLGIERQAARWLEGEMASLVPIAVEDAEGEPVATVRASYADLLWGVAHEPYPLYPSFGVSLRTGDELEVIYVADGSPAEHAGFQVGDRLLSVDGAAIDSKQRFNRLVAAKRWGDTALAVVRRGEEELRLEVLLRRQVDAAAAED